MRNGVYKTLLLFEIRKKIEIKEKSFLLQAINFDWFKTMMVKEKGW